MTITFSRRLAFLFGVLAPLGETVRRWHQLGQLRYLPAWLDDYIIGALLLYGAWRTGRDLRGGQRFLAAAWGFTCGMAYASFFIQFEHLHDDPGPISGVWVAAIKGAALALATLALAGSLRRLPDERAA